MIRVQMDGYKFDQVVINDSFHIYDPGQADPTLGSEVASSSSKFCPYEMETIKAKIMAHPQYSTLLQAYLDCRQVGAPPDVVAGLVAARREFEAISHPTSGSSTDGSDRELDNFMEFYYEMLVRYRKELCRPIQEATEFMKRIESQLTVVVNGSATGDDGRIFHHSDDKYEDHGGSSEEDEDDTTCNIHHQFGPHAEDTDLIRKQLLRKYSGCLTTLKQELSKKKKKKGKLPKEAREKLFSWWESHQRWPYPSESEKLALTESTGLDPKQINNWFINQRKRHWKPSEDMELVMMNGIVLQAPQTQSSVLYMDGHYMNDHNGPNCH